MSMINDHTCHEFSPKQTIVVWQVALIHPCSIRHQLFLFDCLLWQQIYPSSRVTSHAAVAVYPYADGVGWTGRACPVGRWRDGAGSRRFLISFTAGAPYFISMTRSNAHTRGKRENSDAEVTEGARMHALALAERTPGAYPGPRPRRCMLR